jgi:hypothetical protein
MSAVTSLDSVGRVPTAPAFPAVGPAAITTAVISDYSAFMALEAEWNDAVDRAAVPHPFLRHEWIRAMPTVQRRQAETRGLQPFHQPLEIAGFSGARRFIVAGVTRIRDAGRHAWQLQRRRGLLPG